MLTIAPSLTNKGRSLLVRGLAGEAITFTRFKVGNGTLAAGADQDDLTDLINAVTPFSIDTITQNQNGGYVTLKGNFSSAANSAAWKFKELGVFAKGEDNVEWLYAYAYDAENGSTLPDTTSGVIIEQSIEVIIAIGEAQNVTAIVTQSALYASAESFNNHIWNSNNPHGVTAQQIGLGNVPNVATDDQTPSFDTTLTGPTQVITSGENLRSIMGKIGLAIRNLIAHIANHNNPHGVTASQAGAAALKHEHAATDMTSGILPIQRGGTGVGTIQELNTLLQAPFAIGNFVGDGSTRKNISLGFTPTEVYLFPLVSGATTTGTAHQFYCASGKNLYHSGCGATYYSSSADAMLGRGHGGMAIINGGFAVGYSSGYRADVNISGVLYMYIAMR